MLSDTSLTERSLIVASLVTGSAPAGPSGATDDADPAARRSRALVHLGKVSDSSYSVGIATSGDVTWHDVGHLALDASVTARVLLAGLSASAMAHVRAADVQIGDPVLVFGADPWSLLLLQWARLQGASPLVFASPRSPSFSEQAASQGVDAHLLEPTPGDLARAVKLTHRGGGFAVALDGMASERSMTQALSALRDGGRYVLAGINPQPYVLLNAYPDLHRRDLEIVSATQTPTGADFARLFRFSLTLADQGRLQLERLLEAPCGWQILRGDTTR
jgi:threonine dehydrogenase-like Zn-dependent dehydrogenase